VTPLGPEHCLVTFEYYLDRSRLADAAFVEESLEASREVQQEDVALCEGVQRGLSSPAYNTGR
jgi:choline monooxygenase